MSRRTTVPRAATLGLFAAWVVHDLEEPPTMAAWTRRQARRLPWARPMSQAHVNVAIALMGVVVAAGAVAGARTGGRSGFYQAVLASLTFAQGRGVVPDCGIP